MNKDSLGFSLETWSLVPYFSLTALLLFPIMFQYCLFLSPFSLRCVTHWNVLPIEIGGFGSSNGVRIDLKSNGVGKIRLN